MPERNPSNLSSPTPTRIRAILRTARRLASEVGTFVEGKHRGSGQRMQSKGRGDFVTAVDLEAERKLRRSLSDAHPHHAILGEELPPHQPGAEFTWILDPIDGTSNYGRGLPTYAVSVACMHGGAPLAAAVYCLPEAEIYSAGRGLGSFRGRRRLGLKRSRLTDASILGVQWHRGKNPLRYLEGLTATGSRVRNLGCTVTQLCHLAAGRLDGNIQEQGKIWDIAAAALIVTEAGGRFTDWRGRPIFPTGFEPDRHHPSIAAPPGIHGRLCKLLGPWQTAAMAARR
ncbi:MAG: inositol monophosphatase [Planctomycetota bacterium]|nr:inositol monophosphatase [Planctomycetota bacterium]